MESGEEEVTFLTAVMKSEIPILYQYYIGLVEIREIREIRETRMQTTLENEWKSEWPKLTNPAAGLLCWLPRGGGNTEQTDTDKGTYFKVLNICLALYIIIYFL